jgi:hypothetical protein
VNFGSYSTVAAADKLVASLRGSALAAKREAVTAHGKTMQRVRIGPYATRAEGRIRAPEGRAPARRRRDPGRRTRCRQGAAGRRDEARAEARHRQARRHEARDRRRRDQRRDAHRRRQARHAGRFRHRLRRPACRLHKAADANALRDRLRAAGFSAFTEVVNTDKGTLTRVRVGPVLNRAEADQLKAQVKSKVGLDGVVRPHP